MKKQRNTTIASFNYLHEISVISKTARIGYLKKLLNRKNSANQKNVKFLTVIYSYVDEKKISSWESPVICKQLGISTGAFYKHKSRLLKELREYYFNWKEIEKEIELAYKDSKSNKFDKRKEPIGLMLAKARKMDEIGMVREAKHSYLMLEKLIKNSMIDQTEKYLIISEAYEYLAYYYFNRRKREKLEEYLEKTNKSYRAVKFSNRHITKEADVLFNIRLNYIRFYLFGLKWYSNPKTEMRNDYMQKIYVLSKEVNNSIYLLRAIHIKALMGIIKGDLEKAMEFCTEGYNLAKKIKEKTAFYTFASMIYFIKRKTSQDADLSIKSIVNYFYQIKENIPHNRWTVYLANSIILSYYPDRRKEIFEVFHELINSAILRGEYSFAVYWKFILDSEKYNDTLLQSFNHDSVLQKGYLEIKKVDSKLLDGMEKVCVNTLYYHKELHNQGFIWDVYKINLAVLYFNEDTPDYESIILALNKLEYLKKANRKTRTINEFELLKLAVKMIEHSGQPKLIMNKYGLQFRKTIDEFKNKPHNFSITDYSIISSLARRLKCKEITSIVKDLYHWLETNHPEILEPAFRAIKERENKIYTVSGAA